MNRSSFRPAPPMTRSAPTVDRKCNGFTLIELLVVISIISLLISILLPSLAGARKAAESTQCLSRQRQIGFAIQMYCTDEDGFYPVYTPQGDPLKWSGMLWEENYVPDPIVYDCPSFNSAYNFASRDWSTSTSRDGIFNYPEFGYNHLWVGTKYRITGDRTQNRQVEIHTPSNTVLVCDTFRRDLWDDTEVGYYIVQDSDGSPYQAHGRHFRSVNTAWLDGHVSTSGQVADINHPTIEPNAALLRWPLEGNVWDGGQY